ncbi:hypothetical protein H8E88_15200 [candidate division KSB1 bacterium]|nr:hypothetical protein [candidate division KSB1 bacterium]
MVFNLKNILHNETIKNLTNLPKKKLAADKGSVKLNSYQLFFFIRWVVSIRWGIIFLSSLLPGGRYQLFKNFT